MSSVFYSYANNMIQLPFNKGNAPKSKLRGQLAISSHCLVISLSQISPTVVAGLPTVKINVPH